jgi:hypothetical protein
MTTGMVWNIRACVVTLTAVVMVTVAAAPASALRISENTIRRECRAANGTYVSEVKQGTRFSACAYRDIYGDVYTDFYVDGEYDHTKP